MQETQKAQVWSLSQEDTLEKEMTTHSSILAGKSHGHRSLVGYIQSMESQRVGDDWCDWACTHALYKRVQRGWKDKADLEKILQNIYELRDLYSNKQRPLKTQWESKKLSQENIQNIWIITSPNKIHRWQIRIRKDAQHHRFTRESESHSVVSASLGPHGLYSPWNSPGQNTRVAFPFSRVPSQPRDQTQVSHNAGGFFTSWATGKPKNTGVSSLSLLQGIFLTQELNRGLLHCRQILYQLSPRILEWVAYLFSSGSSQIGIEPGSLALKVDSLPTELSGKTLRDRLAAATAASAKSLQSCPTLCDPIDGSPPGAPVPGILQARTLECVAISFSNAWKWKGKVKSLSRVWLVATPWTAAYQALPSMGFSRQEY